MRNVSKLTLKDIQELVKKRGGRCLSPDYKNGRSKLLWECANGHQWEGTYRTIKRHWCPECAIQKRKNSIEDMQKMAIDRGGKCLSNKYINNSTKLLWECAEGHQWEAKPNNIKFGRWCPYCNLCVKTERITQVKGTMPKATVAEMHKIAKERGGECLSGEYINSKTKLSWKCINGHEWQMRPNDVKRHWCPYCGKVARKTIEDMRKLAENRGGKCLSETYLNIGVAILWECKEGHQWTATPRSIQSGKWCPHCAGKAKRTIEEMQKIAKERSGKFLSTNYIGIDAKYLWECEEGHQWKTTPSEINRGRWCPICSSGLGERICREFFEQLFGVAFPKSYPNWLINKNGNQMELDGYSSLLGIAFEHQGRQHYSIETSFIRTQDAFQNRQKDDQIKRDLCTQHGIFLFEIPEILTYLQIRDIKNFIREQCNQHGIALPIDFDEREVDIKNAYANPRLKTKLKELQDIAQKRGGKCLTNIYTNNSTKLLWECAQKHQWTTTPKSIQRGYWCPYCAGTAKGTLEEMQQIAEERGGKCLADAYINSKTKLLWECACGHQWQAIPVEISRGCWCPKCRSRKNKHTT